MERPRAADDFEVIRERLDELRRERGEIRPDEPSDDQSPDAGGADDAERRRREKCEGVPPPWVPTIFLPRQV